MTSSVGDKQHTHSLAKHLKTSLGHQSRIDLIALVIFGLIQMGSVNLSRIAGTLGHGTGTDSGCNRLKRSFARSGMEHDDIARMVAKQEGVIPTEEAVAKVASKAETRQQFFRLASPTFQR